MSERPYQMRAGQEVIEALDRASKGVDAAATELSELSQKFYEAFINEQGEIVNGIGLQYEVAIKEEIITIYELAIREERRPPPADVRTAQAERAVRVKQPELWAEMHHTKARIDALKSWISNQKATISANQSIRNAEAS